jgi:XTP/dITP diphosphohydrolase
VTARLLFATGNAGKLAELQALVGPGVEVVSTKAFPDVAEPLEDAETFEGNARKKALHWMRATGLPALADDSGLCVDALDGAPGVRSARYAEGTDADRVAKLLGELERVPEERRGARFECALCLALPDGTTVVETGRCEGRIGLAPRGTNGFGYDPVFEVPRLGKTLAELTRAEKSALSHRGEAFRKMRPHLPR